MALISVKINKEDENLYCVESKEKIEIGEKYAFVIEDYYGDTVLTPVKLEYLPVEPEDDDEPYIVEEE
jgi:hypothetical protein